MENKECIHCSAIFNTNDTNQEFCEMCDDVLTEQEKEEIDDTQGNNHNNAKHFSSAKNEIISNSSGFDINNSKKLFNTTSLSPVIPKQSNKKIKKTESNVSKQKKKISKNS